MANISVRNKSEPRLAGTLLSENNDSARTSRKQDFCFSFGFIKTLTNAFKRLGSWFRKVCFSDSRAKKTSEASSSIPLGNSDSIDGSAQLSRATAADESAKSSGVTADPSEYPGYVSVIDADSPSVFSETLGTRGSAEPMSQEFVFSNNPPVVTSNASPVVTSNVSPVVTRNVPSVAVPVPSFDNALYLDSYTKSILKDLGKGEVTLSSSISDPSETVLKFILEKMKSTTQNNAQEMYKLLLLKVQSTDVPLVKNLLSKCIEDNPSKIDYESFQLLLRLLHDQNMMHLLENSIGIVDSLIKKALDKSFGVFMLLVQYCNSMMRQTSGSKLLESVMQLMQKRMESALESDRKKKIQVLLDYLKYSIKNISSSALPLEEIHSVSSTLQTFSTVDTKNESELLDALKNSIEQRDYFLFQLILRLVCNNKMASLLLKNSDTIVPLLINKVLESSACGLSMLADYCFSMMEHVPDNKAGQSLVELVNTAMKSVSECDEKTSIQKLSISLKVTLDDIVWDTSGQLGTTQPRTISVTAIQDTKKNFLNPSYDKLFFHQDVINAALNIDDVKLLRLLGQYEPELLICLRSDFRNVISTLVDSCSEGYGSDAVSTKKFEEKLQLIQSLSQELLDSVDTGISSQILQDLYWGILNRKQFRALIHTVFYPSNSGFFVDTLDSTINTKNRFIMIVNIYGVVLYHANHKINNNESYQIDDEYIEMLKEFYKEYDSIYRQLDELKKMDKTLCGVSLDQYFSKVPEYLKNLGKSAQLFEHTNVKSFLRNTCNIDVESIPTVSHYY